MKKGTKVSWPSISGIDGGTGVTISDEDETGNVLVAADSFLPKEIPVAYRMVAYCKVALLIIKN